MILSFAVAALQAAPTPARQAPVCIGRTLDACLASLRTHLRLNEGMVAGAKEGLDDVDLNGRHIYDRRAARFSASPPGSGYAGMVETLLDANGRIRQISFDLFGDPLKAETASQYDDTGLYAYAATMVDGTGCAQSDRQALYLFFQNVVKPTVRATRSAGETDRISSVLPLCGYGFKYAGAAGERAAFVSRGNGGRRWAAYTITFTAPASAPARANVAPPRRKGSSRRGR
jgi:hypothetical protein